MLEVFLVNFQRSITVFILLGSPSITLLSLSFLTVIISLTNLTVKKRAVAVFFGGTYLHLDEASHCLMLDPDWRVGLTVITEWWRKKITV